MRDVLAALAALALLIIAASLATTLQGYGGGGCARAIPSGPRRSVIAEIPVGDDLTLFSEDAARFY